MVLRGKDRTSWFQKSVAYLFSLVLVHLPPSLGFGGTSSQRGRTKRSSHRRKSWVFGRRQKVVSYVAHICTYMYIMEFGLIQQCFFSTYIHTAKGNAWKSSSRPMGTLRRLSVSFRNGKKPPWRNRRRASGWQNSSSWHSVSGVGCILSKYQTSFLVGGEQCIISHTIGPHLLVFAQADGGSVLAVGQAAKSVASECDPWGRRNLYCLGRYVRL